MKVDREERPDLDQVYMAAVQAMTGGGGWPMSVFLTPDGRPFYGGTYFPDEPRHGMPSFRQVLEGVSRAWREDRAGVEAAGGQLVASIVESNRVAPGSSDPTPSLLDAATAAIEASFDATNGGWGRAPKFPQPMTIEYLLRRNVATGDQRPLAVARRSLDAMADGGVHDQLGGGFHRYSTDAEWLVPHFEQMLYDNAQLARVYVHAWTLTGDARYRAVATGTLDYMLRELRTPDGAFAASQDADTEGIEGLTFTWRATEVADVLGEEAPLFEAAYGVTEAGNWEGVTILSRVVSDDEVADRLGIAVDEVVERLAACSGAAPRTTQRAAPTRSRRQGPRRLERPCDRRLRGRGCCVGSDRSATSRGGIARRPQAAAETVVAGLLSPDGVLRRSWKDGRAVGQGVLEDYTHLADGLLALYEATFDERWFTVARALMERVLARFADPAGGFFDTADDHERLVTRPKDVQDNAVPSGNAMAARVLLRLAAWTGEGRYRDSAERALRTVVAFVSRYPTGFAHWLSAMDMALSPGLEVAIVGSLDDAATRSLLAEVRRAFTPNQVVSVAADPAASAVQLLTDRVAVDGRPTAYVCRQFVCRLPVTDVPALREQLDAPIDG